MVDGYVESLNGNRRDELLNGDLFCTVAEARVPLERWREHDDRLCPLSALGWYAPATGANRCLTAFRFAPGGPAAAFGIDDYCFD